MDETQVLKLELDVASINVILAGLGKLPLEVGIKVFNVIQQQAQAQLTSMPQAANQPAASTTAEAA